MRITVVGLGLIGGSLAIALRESGFASQVEGVDSSQKHCDLALELKIVDKIVPLNVGLKNTDLVVIATPVNKISEISLAVLDQIDESVTVTDVGSTKQIIAKAIEKHPRRGQFVLGHPMAGTENSGPMAAQAGLFYGKTAVICDSENGEARHNMRVDEMYVALNMRRIRMNSQDHDRHVAFVSHLSHVSSYMLARTVLEIEKNTSTIFDLAAGGFETTSRLAKSSPAMWLPIFQQNQNNLVEAVDSYIQHLQTFREHLIEKRWDDINDLLKHANQIRGVLDSISSRGKK